jgi:hypothetical protein
MLSTLKSLIDAEESEAFLSVSLERPFAKAIVLTPRGTEVPGAGRNPEAGRLATIILNSGRK